MLPASSGSEFGHKLLKDPVTHKTAQTVVTCVYRTLIAGFWRNVSALWSKNMMNYSMSLSVDSVEQSTASTCKIGLKPWHFWTKKGYKTFEVDGILLEVFWDLRSAKFFGSPEPLSGFYIALVSEEEVVLLLGDNKKKAYKRTKAAPALVDALLFYKRENVFDKKSFSTRAKFDDERHDNEIIVESSSMGTNDPEMWISVDGIVLVHIRNLQWKFRGNQTVVVNKQPVQVFWDVHGWLFCAPETSHGLFIFKPGEENIAADDGSDNGRHYSGERNPKDTSFCLFLYAWKIE